MNWARLARAVVDRRVELGHRTREGFAKASGLSPRLLGDIEQGKRDNYDRVTLARLEKALEWPPGRVQSFLDAPDESQPPDPSEPVEIARLIARDDLVLVALLSRSRLAPNDLFKVLLRIRARREQQNTELLHEVATLVKELGGVAPDPVYPPTWLLED